MSDDHDGGASEIDVPSFEDPRVVLRRHGLHAKRSFSQNFLVAKGTVEAIALAVAPMPQELVVELGPGLGTLTAALLRTGATVVGVERDRDMIAVLRTELRDVPTFSVIEDDAGTVDLEALAQSRGPRKLVVVGNLPYAITGAILKNLARYHQSLDRAFVMVQREVRDRLLADPGTKSYGALSVFTRAAFVPAPVMLIGPGSFFPPPKVKSAVVRLIPRAAPVSEETATFRRVVRAAFETRRKTLRNTLRSVVPDREALEATLSAVGVSPDARGETLSVEEFARLSEEIERREAMR